MQDERDLPPADSGTGSMTALEPIADAVAPAETMAEDFRLRANTLTFNGEIVIATQEHYENAAGLLGELDTAAKQIEEMRLSFTRPLDGLKKRWMDMFRPPLDRLAQTRKSVVDAMNAYRQEVARVAKEKEARLRQEAEEERRRRDTDLSQALATGNVDAAEDVLFAPPVVVPTVNVETPKAAGVTVRKVWKYRIVDEKQIPREYLLVDEKKLAGIATTMKADAKVPGVEFYEEETTVRTGR